MINPQCKTCQYLTHNPEGLDWDMSNEALSVIVDCSKDSIRRHRLHAEDAPLVVSNEKPADQPGGEWIPRRRWDKADGSEGMSWQWVANGGVDGFEWDYSSLIGSLEGFEYTPGEDLTGKPEAFIWADPQFGKAGEEGGGTKETVERSLRARDKFIDRIKVNKPDTVYFVDLGDSIENCFSTGSQIGTNDLSVPDQILLYERITVELLKSLLPFTNRIIHVTVTSNHGEARNGPKNNPYGSENDWGLHMQEVVKDRFSERPDLPVEFVRPDIGFDTAVVETEDGTKVAFAHGHHAGSPANVVKWVEGQVVGEMPGHDAHTWVLGHFHNSYSHSFGKNRMIFGAPSCDPGSGWFTKKKGVRSQPGVLALTFTNKGWANYSIL